MGRVMTTKFNRMAALSLLAILAACTDRADVAPASAGRAGQALPVSLPDECVGAENLAAPQHHRLSDGDVVTAIPCRATASGVLYVLSLNGKILELPEPVFEFGPDLDESQIVAIERRVSVTQPNWKDADHFSASFRFSPGISAGYIVQDYSIIAGKVELEGVTIQLIGRDDAQFTLPE